MVYSAPFAAQEIARASIKEHASHPALQEMAEKGLRWGGGLGSLVASFRGKPLMAGGLALASQAPGLIEHGRSAVKGYKALKESGDYTPEELAKARNVLMGIGAREGALSLGRAGLSAMVASPGIVRTLSKSPIAVPLAVQTPALARWLTAAPVAAAMSKGPQATEEGVEKLRDVLDSSTDVYRGRAGMSPDTSGYTKPGSRGVLLPSVGDLLYSGRLVGLPHGQSVSTAKKIRNEGGIVLSGKSRKKASPSEKVAFRIKEKPQQEQESTFKRVAKKVGIGLGAAAVAGGVGYAALGPAGRSAVNSFAKNPRQFVRGFAEEFKRRAQGGAGHGGYGGYHAPRVEPEELRRFGLHQVKTKAEVRKIWQQQARHHHPDLGGDPEKMKEVNRIFDDFKKSPAYEKLAMLLRARAGMLGHEKLSSAHWPMLAKVLVK